MPTQESLLSLGFAVWFAYGACRAGAQLDPLTWPGAIVAVAFAGLAVWALVQAGMTGVPGLAGLGLFVSAVILGVRHGKAKRAARAELLTPR